MQHEKYYKNFLLANPYPRELKNFDIIQTSMPMYLKHHGKRLINFSSNDYLGLARHPLLIARTQEYAEKFGVGSASSRLVAGNSSLYEKIEEDLAKAIGKPAALILGTGYQTNFSVLEALLDAAILGDEPLVFCDRYCHVSMLASTRYLTRLKRFQHNNFDHLQMLLEKHADSTRPKFILVESVYSMDGDTANLDHLSKLAKTYDALLYVDDAHAVGVLGKTGWGLASDNADHIDIVMGTFSKALGSFGAYIACSTTVRDYLVNKCKGLIYSTGLSPVVLGAISAVIELMPELTDERKKVLNHANQLLTFFQEKGLDYGNASTHIIPWIIGDAKKTLRASELLENEGILGTTIRPPTVHKEKCRIRFCLSAAHSDEDVSQLIQAIQRVEQKL